MGALKGVELIKKERIRQLAIGHSVEDDRGRALELHRAGVAYMQYSLIQVSMGKDDIAKEVGHPSDIEWIDGKPLWPWDAESWKPGTASQNTIKGSALIAAALDWIEDLDSQAGVEAPDLTRYNDEGIPVTDSKGNNLEDGWG